MEKTISQQNSSRLILTKCITNMFFYSVFGGIRPFCADMPLNHITHSITPLWGHSREVKIPSYSQINMLGLPYLFGYKTVVFHLKTDTKC